MKHVRGLNVAVVGINYWPEPTGPAPYTAAMAEHIASSARSVEVVAGLPCYPAWTVEPGYSGKFRKHETRNHVLVHRLAHYIPPRQDAIRRGLYEASYLAHATALRLRSTPNVVIAVSPALGGAVAGARLAKRHNAKLIIIVQDLMGNAAAQSGISGGGKVSQIVARIESWALSQADAVAVVTDGFRPQLAAYGIEDKRICTIRNWAHVSPSEVPREEMRTRLGWAPDDRILLHTGNMGLKQDLGNIIEAARLSQDRSDLRWVLMGDGSQKNSLIEKARGLKNLDFLPLCDAGAYSSILSAADILLLNELASAEEMSLPSKLTSYFMSGQPVVSAVTSTGTTAAELSRAGALPPVRPGDPKELLERLLEMADGKIDGAFHAAQCLAYAESTLTLRGAMAALDTRLGVILGQPQSTAANRGM